MGRFVFLDFDGVIATSSTYNKADEWAKAKGKIVDPSDGIYPQKLIGPRFVANVQRLCALAGAEVVISSTWREIYPFEYLKRWLAEAGLEAAVVGKTPSNVPRRMSSRNIRGLEIHAWMESNGVTAPQIVILEDEEDVSPYRGRQVRTAFEGPHQGFTDRHLVRALRLWGIKLDGQGEGEGTEGAVR